MIRPWHLEIRSGNPDRSEPTPDHWWVAIVGGNGETVFTTETYTREETARDTAEAVAQITGWAVTPQ